MPLQIESLKESVLRLWHDTSPECPQLAMTYSLGQQIQREEEVDRLMESTDRKGGGIQNIPARGSRRLLAVRSRIQKSIVQLLHSFGCAIDDEMEQSFSRVTDEFIHRAYDFDPEITEEAVYQAARNVLIMNTFQMHLGREVSLTPSLFAYSMLYPYTDNYLDAVEIDRQAKHDTNKRMQLRLAGIVSTVRNNHDRMIDRLVGMIESEFDRIRYPSVYESLRAIHAAQCRSIEQQGEECSLSAADLLDISIEKGGASVLADGYLVAGEPTNEDIGFFFQFGVLLQLIDDLQDLQEDSLHDQRTLAVSTAQAGYLDEYANRMIAFMNGILESRALRQQRLHQLIDRSCWLLILEAVASNPSCYSAEYLFALEHRSPVRFNYLRAVKERSRERFDNRPQKAGDLLARVV